MFTGLIEELGTVIALNQSAEGVDLVVRAETVLEDAALGDSIAVQGVCLTISELSPPHVTFGLAPETLRVTSLGALSVGDPVNLERALLPTTRMGGHYVQGHVDATGTLQSIREDGDALWVTMEAPPELLTYVVKKAYIAIDGTSLTVTDVTPTTFSVMLIRHTQPRITLPTKKPGDPINLEVDIMAKFAEKIVKERLQ